MRRWGLFYGDKAVSYRWTRRSIERDRTVAIRTVLSLPGLSNSTTIEKFVVKRLT